MQQPAYFGSPNKPSFVAATRTWVAQAAVTDGVAQQMGGTGSEMGGDQEMHFRCPYCVAKNFNPVRQWHPLNMTQIDHVSPISQHLNSAGTTYASAQLAKNAGAAWRAASADVVPGNAQSAQAIYNDLDNLQVICAGHNATSNKGGKDWFHSYMKMKIPYLLNHRVPESSNSNSNLDFPY